MTISAKRFAATLFALGAVLASLGVARAAFASETEPDGLVVPLTPTGDAAYVAGSGDINIGMLLVSMQSLFDYRGENVDWFKDASKLPGAFSPRCNFTGQLVLRASGCALDFCWYNAVASGGTPPLDSELYTLVPGTSYSGIFSPLVGDPPTKTFTADQIRSDSRYKGGLIGFAVRGAKSTNCSQTHYSQQELNQLCSGCTPPEHWVMSLIWQSTATPDAFYIGFEDLPTTVDSWQGTGRFKNDGDFNDFVFFVTGVSCQGSGLACDTGAKGICANGITQCQKGQVACTQTEQPRTEVCNALDDDCDGTVDDGDLCPAGQVCDQGTCVGSCGEVLYTCSSTEVCSSSGFCVDSDCASVTCPTGQVCTKGTCKAPCDGVTCPLGQVCRSGRCIEPCNGVTCEQGQVCDLGVCANDCTCFGCATGEVCDTKSGLCVTPGCAGKTCPSGQSCYNGTCLDPCVVAICPTGEKCLNDACVDACTDVTCPSGQKCSVGVCVDSCTGVACGPGLKCVSGTSNAGECVDACQGVDCGTGKTCSFGSCGTDCTGVTCPDGETCSNGTCSNPCATLQCADTEVCRDGACVDSCTGVTCQTGQLCDKGICVADPDYLGTITPPSDAGADGAAGAGGATNPDAGTAGTRSYGKDSGGCACRMSSTESSGSSPWMLALGLFVPLLRRRSKRSEGIRALATALAALALGGGCAKSAEGHIVPDSGTAGAPGDAGVDSSTSAGGGGASSTSTGGSGALGGAGGATSTGGSTSTGGAGAGNAGGSVSTGGAGGAAGSVSSGGSVGTGGNATGGSVSTGGSSTGGSVGTGGGGTGCGNLSMTVASRSTSTIQPEFRITNDILNGKNPGSVNVNDLTIRYYFTNNYTAAVTPALQAWVDPYNCCFSGIDDGAGEIKVSLVKMATPKPGADSYFELSFAVPDTSRAYFLRLGDLLDIKMSIYAATTVADDYSFSNSSAFLDWTKVTLYCKGALLLGVEP